MSMSTMNCRRTYGFWFPCRSICKTPKISSYSSRRMANFSTSSASPALVADADSTPSTDATPTKPKPWLVVGLGNPGRKYTGTRHNVGFEMVDTIAEAEGISMNTISFKALFGKGFIRNVPIILAKPQTFMNASGESVGPMASYYKIPLKQVLLIYDDMDLPFAKLRLLPKGGHGGHNGFQVFEDVDWIHVIQVNRINRARRLRMRSVIDHFKGSRDFPRLKIGIGRPPGKMDPVNFVLHAFNKQEREELDFAFHRGLEAVRILLLEGFNKSATFVNSAKPLEELG